MMRINLLKTLETEKKDAMLAAKVPFAVLEWMRSEFGSPSVAARIIIREYLALRERQGKPRRRIDLSETLEILERCPDVVPHPTLFPLLEAIRAVYVAYSGGPPGPKEAQAALKPIIEVAQRVMNPKGRVA